MQRGGPDLRAGFESMFIDWEPPPPIPDWIPMCFHFYFLWTRVVEIVVAANLIWDAGDQKITLWGQTMLLLSPALSQSFESLLGRKSPWKKAAKFSECLLGLLSMPKRGIWPNTKKRGRNPPLTILSDHSSPHLLNNERSLVLGALS